ncbi:MAG: hypothetical protein HQL51_10540 [Magnetococcales bacterium]|nr:hypothetical protein [Magnetococcales bacterium]
MTCKTGGGSLCQPYDPRNGQFSSTGGSSGNQSPAAAEPLQPTLEMPPYVVARNDIPPSVWAAFAAALDRLPGITEREKYVYMMIFGTEGELNVDKDIGTSSGITPSVLASIIRQNKFKPDHPISGPKDMTLAERARYYRAIIDERLRSFGGHAIFSRLGDDKTAAAIADVMFQLSDGAAEWVFQEAMSIWGMGSDSIKQKPTFMTGNTRNNVLAVAADPPKRGTFRDAIAVARTKHFPGGKGDDLRGMNRYNMFR